MSKMSLGLQLYSVHKDMEADYRKTLKQAAALGFEGVEFAGFFGVSAEEMKAELDRLNLKAAGSHTGIDLLRTDLEGVIRYNRILGNKNIVCPYADFKSKEDVDAAVKEFGEIERRLAAEGFVFHYHNHAHEFQKFDGKTVLERIFAETKVHPQPDIYWVYRGGDDPAEFINRYEGRCTMVHMKDGRGEQETVAGRGEIDFGKVIAAAERTGVEWLILEDEVSVPTAFESVAQGFEYLKQCAAK